MNIRKHIQKNAMPVPKPASSMHSPTLDDVSSGPYACHNFGQIQIHDSAPETLQTKLAINQPGDSYEQEAERVAEQVMQMDTPTPSEVPSLSQNIELQDTDASLTRKEVGDTSAYETTNAPSLVNEVLSSGGGQPLDDDTRSFMEPRFGHDFSRVRVHTDERAVESAWSVNALAYTVGQDIVFGREQYNPGANEGNKLLAHELAHVIQQGNIEIGENITTSPMMRLQRQLITPLAQGGGFQGLMERDRDATTQSRDTGNGISIPEAIQGGWRQVRNLDTTILQTANIEQRLAMLAALIQAYWTGSTEEEAIIRILSTTPMTQSTELVKQLSEQTINSKPYLDELDRVVDLGNNLELHNVLSKLRLKAMGPEKGTKALEEAPILPWHDVMGFFEDAATFSFSRTSDGKVRLKYPALLFGSKDFADEMAKLPTDIFTSGHDYEPDQVLMIHDYDNKGKFVPVVAQELLGYEHAGIRGFLGHVTTVASLAIPMGAAETVAGKGAAFVLERLLPAVFLFVDENRLNLVKWLPKWGPKMIYYSDLVQMGVGLYGIARFASTGWKILKSWKEIRQARVALEGVNISEEAEKVAVAFEKQADEIFAEADKIQNGEGETVQATASAGESGTAGTETSQPHSGKDPLEETESSGQDVRREETPEHLPESESTTVENEVEEGIRAEQQTIDHLHELKVTQRGRIVRCSERCQFLEDFYEGVFAKRPDLVERLLAIEEMGRNPSRAINASQEAARLEEDLRVAAEVDEDFQAAQRLGSSTEGTDKISDTPDLEGILIMSQPSEALAADLERQGIHRPGKGYEAHHIIPESDLRAQHLRDLLERESIGINTANNGVWLPKDTQVGSASGSIRHQYVHTKVYFDELTRLLEDAEQHRTISQALMEIARKLSDGEFPF